MTSRPTIVLTHGAFHTGACWDLLAAELDGRGFDTRTFDLPLTDLDADAAAVTAVLDDCDGPVTLVGHSYGGAVITAAGSHANVGRLVYLCALAPDVGEPASGGPVEIGPDFLASMRVTDEGVAFVDPALAPQVFYPDVDPATARRFAQHLRPGHTGGAVTMTNAAWRDRPATYIVCVDDPIILETSQRANAARIGAEVRELPGDHSPMVARPDALADILAEVAAR
ncbi:MAG: alpha/beta hydrolase [Acidimicrobiia bacterium]|nr:alpha/beta hydrolase [Acidimicrobiia bacterium]